MVINFLPISFQDSKTACDGLGAGFGGVAFLASCAKAGIAASTTATSRAPHLLGLFIVSLLVFAYLSWPGIRRAYEPVLGKPGRHTLSDGPRVQAFLSAAGKTWPFGRVHLTKDAYPRHGKSAGTSMISL